MSRRIRQSGGNWSETRTPHRSGSIIIIIIISSSMAPTEEKSEDYKPKGSTGTPHPEKRKKEQIEKKG